MKLLFSIILFLITTFVKSQITGQIVDQQSQQPIEYGTISILQDEMVINGSISDAKGNFSIDKLPNTPFQVSISFLGYDTIFINDLEKKVAEVMDLGILSLRPSNALLEEVVIKATRQQFVNKIDKQVYDIQSLSSNQGNTAVDALKNLPSVSVDGLGTIRVRGAEGFVLLIDNKPLQSDPSIALSQIPSNAIQSIELITAPSAKYDAEGKAGIINVITTKKIRQGDYFQFNVNSGAPSIENYDNAQKSQRYGADATYLFVRNKWNLSTGLYFQRNDKSGRREGDVFTITDNLRTQLPSSGERSFDEQNYSAKFYLDYTPSTKNNYNLGVYVGKRTKDRTADILYYDNHAVDLANDNERLYTTQYYNENLRTRKGDFVIGSFGFNHTFENKAQFTGSFLYEYTLLGGPTTNRNLGYPNTNIVYQDEYNTNDNPLYGSQLQLDYTFAPFRFGTFEMGYLFRNLDHTGDFVYERKNNLTGIFELVPEFSSEVNLNRSLHSGYVQYAKNTSLFSLAAGIRMEHMNRKLSLKDKGNTIDEELVYNTNKWYPSASLGYQLNEETLLKLAYTKRVQRTTTFKMNPFPEREHSETLEQGDPNLKPEYIDQVEIGISRTNKQGLNTYANVYYQRVKNLVNRVNTVYNDSILNRIYSNVGTSKSIGLEWGKSIKFNNKWNAYAGGNLYHHQIDGNFDQKSINTSSWVYSIDINSSYQFNDRSRIELVFNYLSKRITAQGEDSRFYNPTLSYSTTFLDRQLTATLQWKNIDLGLLNSNEQRITTHRPNDFYTTTNYVYEVDMISLNLSYNFNNRKNKTKFIESSFGKNEF